MGSRYDYICNSEDRPHYDRDDKFLRGFHYPMLAPHVTHIEIVNKTEVVEEVTPERIKEVVESMMPEVKDNIQTEIVTELNENIIPNILDEGIDEIYGGSATDVIPEQEAP